MKVKRIQQINCGTFKKYKWDSTVKNFHTKVNIILGWNGSGKTIISRILRSFQENDMNPQSKISNATFTVEFDNEKRTQNKLSGLSNNVRVFNEDYIRETIDKTHLPYVVAIGSAEVDFSKKQIELDQAKEDLAKLTKYKNEFDDISKNISEDIRKINSMGHLKKDPAVESNGVYGSYNKSSFEKRINWITKKVEGEKILSDFIYEEDDLKEMMSSISNIAEKEREYEILKKWDEWIADKIKKINVYLQFLPTYKESERLEKYSDGGIEEKWIREGLNIHKLNNKDKQFSDCLFCNSKILNKNELLNHFSKEVIDLNDALDELSINAENAMVELSTCKKFYIQKNIKLYDFFTTLIKKIKEKRANILDLIPQIKFEVLFKTKEVFDVESTAWNIEIDYVARAYEKYKEKEKEFYYNEKIYNEKLEKITALDKELKELKKAVKNVQIPADRFNKLLKSTFPYKKIELDDTEDEIGYLLKRNDVECKLDSLSEGERNFIALSYFLLSINDEEEINENSIVVIDDPVSSLDSDSLFQVYAILSGEIENNTNRQYFILTHNLDFFGHLIQNYKKDGKIRDDIVNFYQIGLSNDGASIQELDEVLKNYRSDYLYAITKLFEIKDSTNLDDSILAANLLRRSLETFLHFKYGHGDLRSKLKKLYAKYKKNKLSNSNPTEKTSIEQEINHNEKAMYRFINHGSHEFLGFDKYDVNVLHGCKQRIEDFFEVISTIDKDHFATYRLS